MAVRIACLTAVLTSGFAAPPNVVFAQQAAGGRTGRIAIQPFGPASLPADLKARLNDAAAAGLRASGAEVLSTNDLARARFNAGLGACTDPGCEQRLAQRLDIRYWLRGTCQVEGSTYRLRTELVDVRSGAVQAARDDTCDICTEADAAETTNVAASALKASLARASVPAGSTAGAPTVHAAVARGGGPATNVNANVASKVPGGTSPTPREQEAPGGGAPLWRRLLPWAAFAAAVGAGGGGAYYLAIDNRGYQCKGAPPNCPYYNATVWQWGVPLIAAGTALAATGLVLLFTGDSTTSQEPLETIRVSRTTGAPASFPSTRLVISADRLGLAGTF